MRKLSVYGLASDSAEEFVESLFETYGDIEDVQMILDRKGRPTGAASVLFEQAEDALRAAKSLNGVSIDGDTLTIELEGEA